MGIKSSKQDDFIIVSPHPISVTREIVGGGAPIPDDEKKKIRDEIDGRHLDKKIHSTSSALRDKELHDESKIYFIAETTPKATASQIDSALTTLKAEVHSHLGKEHKLLLVSAPQITLDHYIFKGLPLAVKKPFVDFRPLELKEQISEDILDDSNWTNEAKPLVIHLIPNVDTRRTERYFKELAQYFETNKVPILWKTPVEYGALIVVMNGKVAKNLLEQSNYIFKIHRVPRGILTTIPRDGSVKIPRIKAKSSSVELAPTSSANALPVVCVADSGVDIIPALSGHIVGRKKYPNFGSPDDGRDPRGHGTPIACLVVHGECNGSPNGNPRARIISHKIYSDQNRDDALQGMFEAIRENSSESKIFVSSVNFENADHALPTFALLDKIIQERNICFVSSAGNIDDELKEVIDRYPTYIQNYHVLHPAQNAHVIGVGSIARKANADSVARRGELSPFTRCGKTLKKLYDVCKPDIAEHGGNICHNFHTSEIGVSSFCKNGDPSDDFAGTSFSAPLIAGRLAEIVAKYGHRIRNAETFKAVLFMFCDNRNLACCGHGTPQHTLGAEPDSAVFVSEGNIRLSDLTIKGSETEYWDEITIGVPKGVRELEICLVHSDDYNGMSEPSLDTYLEVEAWKTGRENSPVDPTYASPRKSYVRFLSWNFKTHSMEGQWRLKIIPQTTEIMNHRERKGITVRYGCVIKLTSRSAITTTTLTNLAQQQMRRWGLTR
ncbi:MAG: S8 family serine peptidase [Thaumarchaeota archaeon]|nr:S8 family serine peptidase [Nitrososphaerota archaeon]MCL5317542.1 S8 family serine peptidase [Nitrososphaerota archaeon]